MPTKPCNGLSLFLVALFCGDQRELISGAETDLTPTLNSLVRMAPPSRWIRLRCDKRKVHVFSYDRTAPSPGRFASGPVRRYRPFLWGACGVVDFRVSLGAVTPVVAVSAAKAHASSVFYTRHLHVSLDQI